MPGQKDEYKERGGIMEYIDVFKNKDGTEVEIKMKTECHTQDELDAAISFMAQCSRKFYLQAAEKISSML